MTPRITGALPWLAAAFAALVLALFASTSRYSVAQMRGDVIVRTDRWRGTSEVCEVGDSLPLRLECGPKR